MRLIMMIAGAAVASVPMAADASTLKMRIDGGAAEYIDNGSEDASALEDVLAITGVTAGGYEYAGTTAIKQSAPPMDQLQTSVDVFNKTGGEASIEIEVTGHFSNAVGGDWLGAFSSSANDATGSDWLIQSFIGDTEYGRDLLAMSNTGSVTAVRNVVWFDPSDYWITHVFNHTAQNNVSASASADFVTAIPVPAAGWLLFGALGGLAAMRRRHKVA